MSNPLRPASEAGTSHPLVRLLAAAALVVTGAGLAQAAPLSAVTSSLTCVAASSVATDTQTQPGSCGAGGEGLFAVGEARTSPFTSLNGSADALDSGAGRSARVTGTMHFEFQLLGGSAGDLVPLQIATHLLTLGDDADHRWGRASMQVSQVDIGATTRLACTAGVGCGGADEYFGSVLVWVRSGGAEGGPAASIDLSIEAFAGDSGDPESAFASANYAHVFVHPHFARANDYALSFSDRITNASPDDAPVDPLPLNVPEPATLPLLALAWGLAGRRTRRPPAAALGPEA